MWHNIKNWLTRIWYCHHNAKVLEAMEWRFSQVLCRCTDGAMSKPYYELTAMYSEIDSAFQKHWNHGYNEGRDDRNEEELPQCPTCGDHHEPGDIPRECETGDGV